MRAGRLGTSFSPLSTDAMPADPQPALDGPAEFRSARTETDAQRPWSHARAIASVPMLALTAWTAAWFAILARHGGIAWVFFVKGSSLLFTGHYNGHNRPGFLHVYQSYPGIQIGPLALGAAQVLRTLIPGQPIGPYQGVVLPQRSLPPSGRIRLALSR